MYPAQFKTSSLPPTCDPLQNTTDGSGNDVIFGLDQNDAIFGLVPATTAEALDSFVGVVVVAPLPDARYL